MRLTNLWAVMACLVGLAWGGTATAQTQGGGTVVTEVGEYLGIDVANSTISTNAVDNTKWRVTIKVNYKCIGDQQIGCCVFDENSSKWVGVNQNIVPISGEGIATFGYDVAKNSAWGIAIGNGTFNQAYAWVTMTSGTAEISLNDDRWVYGPNE